MKKIKALALTAFALLLSSTPGKAEIVNQNCLDVGSARICDIYDDEIPGSFGRSFIEVSSPSYGVYFLTSTFTPNEAFVMIAEETGEYFSVNFNQQGEVLGEAGNRELFKKYYSVVVQLIHSMAE